MARFWTRIVLPLSDCLAAGSQEFQPCFEKNSAIKEASLIRGQGSFDGRHEGGPLICAAYLCVFADENFVDNCDETHVSSCFSRLCSANGFRLPIERDGSYFVFGQLMLLLKPLKWEI